MTAIDPIALASALIKRPSVTPADEGAIDILIETLKPLGFVCADMTFEEDGAELHVPADLTPEQQKEAQRIAAQIFLELECDGMARIDLFLDRQSGRLLFNEANTIPGFTAISMYPQLWEASGLPYGALLTRLIELALARAERRSALKRDR